MSMEEPMTKLEASRADAGASPGILAALLHLAAVAATVLGSLWFAAWVASTPVKAEGDTDRRWIYRTIRRQYRVCEWGECRIEWRWERRRYPNHSYDLPETRIYGYVRRDEGRCKEVRRAVGDQHLTVDGAKKAANDAWAAAVRFHSGEKWIDLANARGVTYTCSRSSIKEGGSSVTTLGQQLNRCEIEAVPCAPIREREER